MRRDHPSTSVDLTIDVDPSEQTARFDAQGTQFILRQGEWSSWVRAEYSLIPHVKSVHGIFRVYLQQVHPYLRVYVSPVNIDPEDPALPISTPPEYSSQPARAAGPFSTPEITNETPAFPPLIPSHS